MGLFGLGEPKVDRQAAENALSQQEAFRHILSKAGTELGATGKVGDYNAKDMARAVMRMNTAIPEPDAAKVMEALARGIGLVIKEDSAGQ